MPAKEIAEAAIGAAEAGAAIVHLHARDPKDGRPASLRSVQTVPAKLSSSARTAWSTARPAAPRTCRWRSVCGRRRTGRVGWFNGKSPRGWLVDTSAPKSSLCRCETALIMLAAFSAITRVGASVWPVVTRGITVPVLPFGASLPCSMRSLKRQTRLLTRPSWSSFATTPPRDTALAIRQRNSRIILTEMPRTRAAENLLKFAMDRAGTAHRWRHCRPG